MSASHHLFAAPDIERTDRADGTQLLESRMPLGTPQRSIGKWLQRWATEAPDRPYLAERATDDNDAVAWTVATYGEVWARARALGEALLERGLGPDRAIAVLSPPSIAHAELMLAAHLAGVPFVPVSVAYSTVAHDRLRFILNQIKPGLVFVEHPAQVEPIAAELDASYDLASGDGALGVGLDELAATEPTIRIDAAFDSVGPDTVAKILYTSGSTGNPKGVITTHRMLCGNQQAIAKVWPFLADHPPVICDWLPWSHTFGSSHNFNLALANGGTFYIDGGKPAPGLFDTTVANLVDVRPTISFNVPAGYARLVERLEADADAAAAFFSRLQVLFYAAASLPPDTWRRLEELSRSVSGDPVQMTTSWGLTETSPAVTSAHFDLDGPGVIGTPLPGVTLKLVPTNDKTEVRIKGHPVTPGYFDDPERTAAMFDEEGFFKSGDAMYLADPDDPNAGLVFDGRTGEDFKLMTGTWVSVGVLRPAIVSATAPLVMDCVVTGADREWIGLLVWLAPGVVDDAATRERLVNLLATHNANSGGTSSTRVARAIILNAPASIADGEITDKGYVNQHRTLAQRATDVERLYAATPDPDVLIVDATG